eukprot:COSAG04_NODE_17159_length_477_cov_1.203704_1_plen_130_part_10
MNMESFVDPQAPLSAALPGPIASPLNGRAIPAPVTACRALAAARGAASMGTPREERFERMFAAEPTPDEATIAMLAAASRCPMEEVERWFQQRRARPEALDLDLDLELRPLSAVDQARQEQTARQQRLRE